MTNNVGDLIEGATLCTSLWNATGSSTSCGVAQSGKGGQFELHVSLGEIGVFFCRVANLTGEVRA